ncbi:MAG: nitroreductase [Lachnospiraceae bacterium]|jgi:hypothetical protein|nr:nitroreductase [Lachnospiraceae bacterium]
MDIKQAIKERHSVRQFEDRPIDEGTYIQLQQVIARCNQESGLHIQLICDEPECFRTILSHYGQFRNANNYIALIGKRGQHHLKELCGYYGEKIVLEAQKMGLRTCWVGGTYSRRKCIANVRKSDKLVCVIAIGYGANDGMKHRSKPVSALCNIPPSEMPTWFKNGMVAAMMAPTAVNQQQFYVKYKDGQVSIKSRSAFMSKIDLGIVKYHFEAVTGRRVL